MECQVFHNLSDCLKLILQSSVLWQFIFVCVRRNEVEHAARCLVKIPQDLLSKKISMAIKSIFDTIPKCTSFDMEEIKIG